MKLAGKVALVTGAARKRGLGRAIAMRLAQDGADVIVTGRPNGGLTPAEEDAGWQGLASVVADIKALGRRAMAVETDVTKKDDVAALAQAIANAFGRIDILVNNAGHASGAGSARILDMDDATWFDAVDVNLNGVYLVTKAIGRLMRDYANGGSIINISSLAGRRGLPDYGAYCATKFGVVGLTQQLALELAGLDIRVNCIAPGSHSTDMMDGTLGRTSDAYGISPEDALGAIKQVVPMGRQGLAEELAAACAFLAGPDASYITGQTLNVDGGAQLN
ncbi:MAG: SDR family NAD(P)-dependent oxidoreductase [Pseudomonadota bacterium]